MKGKIRIWGLLAAAVALFTPPAYAQTTDQTLQALREKARAAKEDRLVIYTPYVNSQVIWDAFMQDFPEIRVTFTSLFGAGLFSRLSAEAASGNYAGDMTMISFMDQEIMIKDGRLDAEMPATAAALDARYRHPGNYYQDVFTNLYTLVYNTNLVKEHELPSTFNDVLSPKWKGRVVHTKFSGTNIVDIIALTLSLNGSLTDDQLKQLKENGQQAPTAYQNQANVAQGRAALGLWAGTHSAVALQKEGAPLKVHHMPDSSVQLSGTVALLKNAPHPNAARLMKAWLFTPRGQAALAHGTYSYGTMPGAPAPAGFPDLSNYKFTDLPRDRAPQLLADFRKKTLAIWGE